MSNIPTVIKKLSFTWTVSGQEVTEIEMRPSTMEDVCAAEAEVSPMRPNTFNMEMASRQLVRAGSHTGPFASAQFKKLAPREFSEINAAAQEADLLGKS